MLNMTAFKRLIDELVDAAWGYGFDGEGIMGDVERLKHLIFAMVDPEHQALHGGLRADGEVE